MRGSASTTCDRCGSEMTTSLGHTYSRWMSTKRSGSDALHCSNCRNELADPSQRSISLIIDIDEDDQSAEFTIGLHNDTQSAVGFALSAPDGLDDEQWNDESAWGDALHTLDGLVGVLTVTNEDEAIVFEHCVRKWFSSRTHRILESQMTVGGERSKTFTARWTHPDSREPSDFDPYMAEPTTAPTEHAKLTGRFDIYARPRTKQWAMREATTTFTR